MKKAKPKIHPKKLEMGDFQGHRASQKLDEWMNKGGEGGRVIFFRGCGR